MAVTAVVMEAVVIACVTAAEAPDALEDASPLAKARDAKSYPRPGNALDQRICPVRKSMQ